MIQICWAGIILCLILKNAKFSLHWFAKYDCKPAASVAPEKYLDLHTFTPISDWLNQIFQAGGLAISLSL